MMGVGKVLVKLANSLSRQVAAFTGALLLARGLYLVSSAGCLSLSLSLSCTVPDRRLVKVQRKRCNQH